LSEVREDVRAALTCIREGNFGTDLSLPSFFFCIRGKQQTQPPLLLKGLFSIYPINAFGLATSRKSYSNLSLPEGLSSLRAQAILIKKTLMLMLLCNFTVVCT